jgi:hypothetical protein
MDKATWILVEATIFFLIASVLLEGRIIDGIGDSISGLDSRLEGLEAQFEQQKREVKSDT